MTTDSPEEYMQTFELDGVRHYLRETTYIQTRDWDRRIGYEVILRVAPIEPIHLGILASCGLFIHAIVAENPFEVVVGVPATCHACLSVQTGTPHIWGKKMVTS